MIQGINHIDLTVGKTQAMPVKQAGTDSASFADMLSDAIEKMDQLDKESHMKQVAFAQGEDVEIHEVVIAMEKYSVAMQLLMTVRNKIVEAYQEITRMPV